MDKHLNDKFDGSRIYQCLIFIEIIILANEYSCFFKPCWYFFNRQALYKCQYTEPAKVHHKSHPEAKFSKRFVEKLMFELLVERPLLVY